MNIRTLDELIQLLEEKRDQVGGEAIVRIAEQPSYPLQSSIAGVVSSDDIAYIKEEQPIVWIAEGSQCRPDPYAPKDIWDEF